jgi:hypothetical protein
LPSFLTAIQRDLKQKLNKNVDGKNAAVIRVPSTRAHAQTGAAKDEETAGRIEMAEGGLRLKLKRQF